VLGLFDLDARQPLKDAVRPVDALSEFDSPNIRFRISSASASAGRALRYSSSASSRL
jgi:hypothetical protein